MVSSQDVISFKAYFPPFAAVKDADVAAVLNTANVMIQDDGTWSPSDYPMAINYYAAWLLSMIQLQGWSMALMSLAGQTAIGGGAGDLYVANISFGERRVSFGRRVPAYASNKSTLGPGEELLSLNIYGQLYQQLRWRNCPPILVI